MRAPSVSFHNLENKFSVPRMEYLNPSMDLTSSMGGFHERTSGRANFLAEWSAKASPLRAVFIVFFF